MIYGKYTVVLKTLLDNEETKEKLNKAMSTYPLYEKRSKEEFIPSIVPTREQLNKKILDHYKYREIGFETVGRFLDELEISLNEIMPKYNLLFLSCDQDFNVIWNVDYKKEIAMKREGENSNTSQSNSSSESDGSSYTESSDNNQNTTTGEGNSKNVESATPQGILDIGVNGTDSVNYADNVKWNKDNNTSTSNSKGSAESESDSHLESSSTSKNTSSGSDSVEENTVETTKGNFGVVSAQDLVLKFRETIRNIEQEIINDERISELFMKVY